MRWSFDCMIILHLGFAFRVYLSGVHGTAYGLTFCLLSTKGICVLMCWPHLPIYKYIYVMYTYVSCIYIYILYISCSCHTTALYTDAAQ